MAITLYDHPFSPYAQKVKLSLLEKQVPYTAQMPAGIGSGTSIDDFVRASPRGEVPALIDGDVQLFDSTIILEYIEDRWPAPPLMPTGPAARARVRTIEETMDTHFEAITWGLAEIHHFGRAEGALRDAMVAEAAAQLNRWYAWLEARLGDAPYFGGDRFDRADICVAPFVNGTVGFGLGPARERPIGRWLAKVNERPSMQRVNADIAAVNAASASGNGFEGVRELVRSGQFKREYRDYRLEWMVRTGGVQVVIDGLAANNIRFVGEFPA